MISINFEQLTFHLNQIHQLDPKIKKQIFKAFNSFGFFLIESKNLQASKEIFLSLSCLLGNIVRQNQSDEQGVFPIRVLPNFAEYANSNNRDLALHTDGSFEKIPPKVMAMQCEVAAQEGGLTQLVDGKLVYDYLAKIDPEGLATLFETDIFTIKRANQSATRAIFTNHNHKIYMTFRSDNYAQISVQERAIKPFILIKDFLAEPTNQIIFKLQPHQILVFDNNRILHGRTAFEINDTRILHGLWFDGNSQDSSDLEFGFIST
jgi:alpha-ketoglutarate-dependent taurine dioxygenase